MQKNLKQYWVKKLLLEAELNTLPLAKPVYSSQWSTRLWNDTFLQDAEHNIKPPHIMFLGLRGFPMVQGGIESHVEHLAPMLSKRGLRVEVIVRKAYQPKSYLNHWQGVSFTPLWSSRSKFLEAISHTFLGVLYAAMKRPDILHIQGIGPSLMVPLAKLLGLRTVVTHHGPDYDRQKWGFFAKATLKLGELVGMMFADDRIVISDVISKLVVKKYDKPSKLIANGVALPELSRTTEALTQFGLQAGKYVLIVGRLVPEKRHLDLISAFNQLGLTDYKLVIVGDADHRDGYYQHLKERVSTCENVMMVGFQSGETLNSLYTHAGLFVLPSSHEGLSISLLEALSYGLSVLVSDIPANLEVGLSDNRYFRMGDCNDLAEKMQALLAQPYTHSDQESTRQSTATRYNWNHVADQTMDLYLQLLK